VCEIFYNICIINTKTNNKRKRICGYCMLFTVSDIPQCAIAVSVLRRGGHFAFYTLHFLSSPGRICAAADRGLQSSGGAGAKSTRGRRRAGRLRDKGNTLVCLPKSKIRRGVPEFGKEKNKGVSAGLRSRCRPLRGLKYFTFLLLQRYHPLRGFLEHSRDYMKIRG